MTVFLILFVTFVHHNNAMMLISFFFFFWYTVYDVSKRNFSALDYRKKKYLFYYNVFFDIGNKKQINHTIYKVKVIYSYLNKTNFVSN